MARVIVGSYMFRYPLGGMLSWVLQYLIGLKELGHDVYFVEKFGYDSSCYNPVKNIMSNDCSYGLSVVSDLLLRFGFRDKWCFVEKGDNYYGLSKESIEEIFASAEIFIDMGTHGSWEREAKKAKKRVWIDGEPGYTQIKLSNLLHKGENINTYDQYFTNGMNVGLSGNTIPTAGIQWKHLFHPVSTNLFAYRPVVNNSFYSTVMNWKSHDPVEYNGVVYGQKNLEFDKFLSLPLKVKPGMEIAISGKNIPMAQLNQNKWKLREGRNVTETFDSFRDYIADSRGEFSVCKNVFVATQSGWFSDKSAAYLSSGRPVILQDTGFSRHLPCGLGLFAVNNLDEAIAAINEIESNFEKHANAARDIAKEYFEAAKVMQKFLDDMN